MASSGTPLFKKLVTRWTIQPADGFKHAAAKPPLPVAGRMLEGGQSAALLSIDLDFAFANPLYAAASAHFFRQVSAMMVEAFEKEARRALGRTPGRQ